MCASRSSAFGILGDSAGSKPFEQFIPAQPLNLLGSRLRNRCMQISTRKLQECRPVRSRRVAKLMLPKSEISIKERSTHRRKLGRPQAFRT
jgi:hypothetical protein